MSAENAMLDVERVLSPRHRRFAWEYCIDRDAVAAAIRAGYDPEWARRHNGRLAHQLLQKHWIKRAIQAREAEISAATMVDAVAITLGLHREALREGEGSSHAARVSAWKELAKIRGLEVSRVEHTVDVRLDGRLAQARARAQLIEAGPAGLPEPGTALAQPDAVDAVDAEFTEVAQAGGENQGVVQAGGG